MMSTVTVTATSAVATAGSNSTSNSTSSNNNSANANNDINNNNSNNNLSWKKTSDGVQVEIPAPPQNPTKRRWSRLHTFEEEQRQQQLQQQRIATSVTTAATTTATNNNTYRNRPLFFDRSSPRQQQQQLQQNDQQNDQDQGLSRQSSSSSPSPSSSPPLTEWLQMICKECATTGPEGGARAFVMGPQPLSIVLCSNRLSTSATNNKAEQLHEMEEILTHELMHVYDVRQLHLDLRDCENLAYSEVRAARAAECSDANTYSLLVNSCVRHKAWQATQNLFPAEKARQCLQKVFDRAMADTRPFGKNWNSTSTSSRASSSSASANGSTTSASANSNAPANTAAAAAASQQQQA
jgi:hypothetical protein